MKGGQILLMRWRAWRVWILLCTSLLCILMLRGWRSKVENRLESAPVAYSGASLGVSMDEGVRKYYINLADNVDRRLWMEEVAFRSTEHAYRIEAYDTTNMDVLIRHWDSKYHENRTRELRERRQFYTYKIARALPGQLGNMMSHLEAVKKAYEDGVDFALITEDDVGIQLRPFWPLSLKDLVKRADEEFPGWMAIRLQWNDYPWTLRKIKEEWIKKSLREKSYRKVPILYRLGSGWGNVATIFHRRAMKSLLGIHHVQILDDLTSVWTCNPQYACVADLTFWPELDELGPVLVTTPPYFTYRLAEVQTASIRLGQVQADHKILHLQSVVRAIQWMLELNELYTPGGYESVPFNTTWNVTTN